MTQTEYEQKKRECWEEFKNATFNGNTSYSTCSALDFAFDRAYQLGKQETKQEIKQETDAEGTVISGWVARDIGRFLGLYPWLPKRGDAAWLCGSCMVLPINKFPDLTWESDPEPVEIIIKRKKK